MFNLDKLSLSYGPKVLFDELNAQILPGERIGLVGPNGAGKSTLLKILAGLAETDNGKMEAAQGATVGYLPQDGLTARGRTLQEEVETAFADILSLQSQIDEASEKLHELSTSSTEYSDLLYQIGHWEHRLEDAEAHKIQSRIEKVLMGLGFAVEDLPRPCESFSGGWQMRIALARLLLSEPSLLLLDEPTNHLDLDSLRWLENYLNNYEGAIILVSHDRAFLDSLTNRTYALESGRFDIYSGNYSYFETQSALRKEALLQSYKSQQKELARNQEFIDRFRSKASKARQVQSRIKAMDKIERIEVTEESGSIHFRFPEPSRSGAVVMELRDVVKRYGELEVYRNLDLKIERGDRIAVVGVNGAGKSTLARILAGAEPIQQGERVVGSNVSLSYFAQHQADALDPETDVLSVAVEAAPKGHAQRARSLLGTFMFSGDDVFKKVKVLSGGEKNRLALARMLLQPFNFLILDEPTNHLDMRSKEVLQEAIRSYAGTIFIVSHDRAFLDPLVDKVFEISKTGLKVFPGNVSEYLVKKESDASRQASAEKASAVAQKAKAVQVVPDAPGMNSKERRRREAERLQKLAPLKKQIAAIETEIAALESEIATLEEAMLDPAFFNRGAETTAQIKRHDQLKNKNDATYLQWSQLQSQLEKLTQP